MKTRVFSIFLLFFVCFHQVTFAARSVIITSDKSSLFGDEAMTVSSSLSGFTDGEIIHIKGAFFKDGSTNYFGFTQNGESWIKNSVTAADQRQITIGGWDTNVLVKSDFDDSGYIGAGDYQFKLGFYYYTSGGNLSSVNWSNTIAVGLDEPAVTPTPLPSPTAIKTPTSEKTPTPSKTPTSGKNPTSTKAPTQTVKSSTTSNSSTKNKISVKITPSSRSGLFTDFRKLSPSPTKRPEKVDVLGVSEGNLLFLSFPAGIILLLVSLGIIGYRYREIIKTWINT